MSYVQSKLCFALRRCIHLSSSNCVKDYYGILGVPKSSSAKEIKLAYYDRAKAFHPDASKDPETAKKNAARFQEISEAYEVLSDDQKRRLYDSTFNSQQHDVYGRVRPYQRDAPYRPGRPKDSISMNHIQQVYKALNKVEHEEIPKYQPFADHNYPGSRFNRFEYSRSWDNEQKCWIYMKKPTAAQYHRQMQEKQQTLITVIAVILLGTLGLTVYNNFLKASPMSFGSNLRNDPEAIQRIRLESEKEMNSVMFNKINKFE